MNRFGLLHVLLLMACGSFAAAADPPPTPESPVSAEDALKYVQLAPGLRMELVACEPQVVDPVAIRFDEGGRMWVVEMRDYPHGPSEGQKPASRIRILTDADGDGRFETAETFADNLLFVTGVQPFMGGAFVTLAGRVAYMKDTDGNGHADLNETWYTGFAQQNSQLRANHPRLGIDNHLYIANGLRGGQVVDAAQPKKPPLSISGMDFRFDPFSRKYEAISGVGQFGLTFDDWGDRFVCSNRNPLKHIVLEDRYLKRNPAVRVAAAFHDVAAAGESSRLFPISRAWTTSTLHAGQFTAACGVAIYRGSALPAEYYGNGFTCDPTGNLVHREVLRPDGATFTSRPGREGVEFLASTDEWFRPVNLAVGPDGALYVVDMYRAVIEHPQFMPEELRRRPDLRHGDDRGRIYRIVAERYQRPDETPKLARENLPGLIGALEHPNVWQRETAARLLLERQDKSAPPALQYLAVEGKTPQARAHALWLLQGLFALSDDVLLKALDDDHVGVRLQALRLAEPRLADNQQLLKAVAARARSKNAAEHYRALLSLGGQSLRELFGDDLPELALSTANDVWTRRALQLALKDDAGKLLADVLRLPAWDKRDPDDGEAALIAELADLYHPGDATADRALLSALAALPEQRSGLQQGALQALLRSLSRARTSLGSVVEKTGDVVLAKSIRAIFQRAADTAADAKAGDAERSEALALLGQAGDAAELIERLALDDPSLAVRRAAIAALARQSSTAPWQTLLERFAGESPGVRRAVLDGVLARPQRVTLLLDAMESGQVKAAELDRARVNQLLKHRDKTIRARAAKLLADAVPADRQQVLADYREILNWQADAQRGREVFKKNCIACHRIGGLGVNVAPDIADSRTKQPAQILTDILQPNRAIDANYVSYTLATADGRSLTGIIVSETASSVTIKQEENKTLTLLRSEIELMQSNGVSLMPEGFEKKITKQQMADLVSFIKNWRYLDGRTPLGSQTGSK